MLKTLILAKGINGLVAYFAMVWGSQALHFLSMLDLLSFWGMALLIMLFHKFSYLGHKITTIKAIKLGLS
jgi:hypothetical protein